MKRYLAFAGAEYYPAGGWHDCLGDFDTFTKVHLAIRRQAGEPHPGIRPDCHKWYGDFRWYHIVDTESGEIVKEEGAKA